MVEVDRRALAEARLRKIVREEIADAFGDFCVLAVAAERNCPGSDAEDAACSVLRDVAGRVADRLRCVHEAGTWPYRKDECVKCGAKLGSTPDKETGS